MRGKIGVETEVFLSTLRSRNCIPANLELSQFGSTYLANAYDSLNSAIITDSVKAGLSGSIDIAIMKSLVESLERNAIGEFLDRPENSRYKKFKSDGFAAFPIFSDAKLAKQIARRNAVAEATERFVWAKWWDNIQFKFDISDIGEEFLTENMNDCLKVIESSTPIDRLYLIEPEVENCEIAVVILFAELKSGGWVSGGAAGLASDKQSSLFRSLSEMLRHSLAFSRIREFNMEPVTFYEKRLKFFADGLGNKLIEERLSSTGSIGMALPALAFDAEISHSNEDIVIVHRALYEDQPVFVGGNLERLCL